jgi:hypothetical protein
MYEYYVCKLSLYMYWNTITNTKSIYEVYIQILIQVYTHTSTNTITRIRIIYTRILSPGVFRGVKQSRSEWRTPVWKMQCEMGRRMNLYLSGTPISLDRRKTFVSGYTDIIGHCSPSHTQKNVKMKKQDPCITTHPASHCALRFSIWRSSLRSALFHTP